MNVRNDTTSSNGAFDEGVKLLISSDSKLQVPWCYPLHLEIFACITSKFKNLSSEVLKNWGQVNSSSGTNTPIGLDPLFQLSMDTTHRKLHQTNSDIEGLKKKKMYIRKNFKK